MLNQTNLYDAITNLTSINIIANFATNGSEKRN